VQDFLSQLAAHRDVVSILFIVLGLAAGTVVWLASLWFRHRRLELEAALKQDMLNRGMSADEIERILRARMGGGPGGAKGTAVSRAASGGPHPVDSTGRSA
jgi:hypothetical protein